MTRNVMYFDPQKAHRLWIITFMYMFKVKTSNTKLFTFLSIYLFK